MTKEEKAIKLVERQQLVRQIQYLCRLYNESSVECDVDLHMNVSITKIDRALSILLDNGKA